MIRADVLKLIAEQQPRGVFETPSETAREVFCVVRSVGMNEAYEAMSHGLKPDLVFDLSDIAEYHGEKLCEWNGKRYRIVRSYVNTQRVELTCERLDGYVVPTENGT